MTQNSNALVTKQRADVMRQLLDKSKDAFASVMPKYMTPDRMMRLGLSAIVRDPKLLECDSRSLLLSLMNAAICGLEPNTPMQEGYLIPRRNRKRNVVEAVFMPSYRGLLKLVRNSGQVASVQAHIVYAKEEFSLDYGANPPIKHVPILDGDPGEPRLVYAIAKMTDPNADPIVQVLTMKDIAKIKKQSESADSDYSPWKTWPDQMMIKSAIRRITKYLPASPEMSMAVTLEDRAAMGESQVDLAPTEMLDAFGVEIEPDSASERIDPETGEISINSMAPGDPTTHQGYEPQQKTNGEKQPKSKAELF